MRRWDIIDAMRKMKKTLLSLAVASLVVLASCGSSKQQPYPNYGYNQQPVQQQPAQPVQQTSEDDEIAALKKQAELEKLKRQIELDRLKDEAEYNKVVNQLAIQEQMLEGNQLIVVFCADEAIDKPGEYMAGLGISSNQLDQRDAMLSANQTALSDISSRFLGVVKNATSYYNKETNTKDRDNVKGSQLEGLAMSVGEEAINKHANVVCRKVVSEKEGGFGCYVAVHVMINDVLEEMTANIERRAKAELDVEFDKFLFQKQMNAELQANQEKEAAKQKEQLKNNGLE